MKKQLIYLDNNATTACAREVVEAMHSFMSDCFGNASSSHYAGRIAFRAVEDAREKLASALDCKKNELFFNSGATEGNNWILLSLLKSQPKKKRILVGATEHKAVLLSALELQRFGFEVLTLPVNSDGVVDLDVAQGLIDSKTALVAIQYANNETGVIQPILELVNLTHKHGALFHCDAVQGLGKAKLSLADLGVDSATFSAHKIHGPKGVGALFLHQGVRGWIWEYPFMGGGQEHEIRPGTLNVPGIVGFGKAAELLQKNLDKDLSYMAKIQACFEQDLISKIPDCKIHGKNVKRIPNTTNVSIPGIPADILMANLPLFCISEGSACNSGAIAKSHVLIAMGCSEKEAKASIRISSSHDTVIDELMALSAELFLQIQKLPRF